MLEQYPVADLVAWLDDKTLILNADFQRRAIWPPAAKTFLIDTVLRNKPIPNLYMRTAVDSKTRRAIREVVDGQQRLRTIQEFVNGHLVLGPRADEFRGMRFTTLDEEFRQSFLAYRIGVVQLFNASDEDVLDIFKRLNSFGYTVNPQELRHGRYQGEFRGAVVQASRRWSTLWEKYKVVGLRSRVRMGDDELMAQMFGVILEGVVDGGQRSIERLYRKYDERLPKEIPESVDSVLGYIVEMFSEILDTTGIARGPHFLMLFAAVAHALMGIPEGDMGAEMPRRDPSALKDLQMTKSNLGVLGEVLEAEEEAVPPRFGAFKMASAGSTQRIRSRKIRFPVVYRALLPNPI